MENQIPPTPFRKGGASFIPLNEGEESATPCLKKEKIIFSPGTRRTSKLDSSSNGLGSAGVYTRVFRCRKNGMDYLGQVRIETDGPEIRVEVFNENYFSHFEGGKNAVLEALKTVVLSRLMKEGDAEINALVQSFLDAKICLPVESFPAKQGELCISSIFPHPSLLPIEEKGLSSSPPVEERIEVRRDANGFDLKEIFDRLNAQYFDNKIRADVGWGRDSKKKNRSAFRFGSYDRAKKLIRIHPRLNQKFVPFPIVELTVYHEMCHQWTPSVRRNGVWRDHHAEFKAKEKEYHFYQEARLWEKENWKKFLHPITEKNSLPSKVPAGESKRFIYF